MTTPQQSPAAPAAAPAETNGAGIVTPTQSYEDRVAAAFADDPSAPPQNPAAPNAPAETAPDEAAQRRAERRKQLDAVLAQERQRVDLHAQRRAQDEAVRRAQALERERDELRQQMTGRLDPSALRDPATFFKLYEENGADPTALGKWLAEREKHPETIAAQYAKKSIDPEIAALKQQLEQQNQLLAQFQQQQSERDAKQEAYSRGENMLTFAQANAAQAPLAARFLQEHGAEEFLKLANSAYAGNVAGWEQHTLDGIEDMLVQLGKIYASPGASPAKPSTTPQPNPGAAKPMTTVSNTLAQSRASVVADEGADWAALPYEERVRRAFE